MRLLLLALLLLAAPALAQRAVFHDARVHTVDPSQPVAEAFAVENGRIVAVGTDTEILARFADWPRTGLGGRTVVPGFIDAHAHLLRLGQVAQTADLVGAASLDETLARARTFEATLPPGRWLTGWGWNQTAWPGAAFPTRADLDAAFPARPVWLSRVDGHAGWANSAAMRAAGLDPDALAPADPPGGQILRDAAGRPTGVFVDAAMALVRQALPEPDDDALDDALALAVAETARHGITGLHDAGASLADVAAVERALAAGRMPLRVHAMIRPAELDAFCAAAPGGRVHASGRLDVRAVKLVADGALGSRGAHLHDDYADAPGQRGLAVTSHESLRDLAERAMRCGLQVNAHAIGDAANTSTLDALDAAIRATGGGPGRHRVEHAQILRPDDLPRLAALGLIASVQPTHATSDSPWAENRIGGERMAGAYAWRRLVDSGARLALGSDAPVERISVLEGFYAAVTRQRRDGTPLGGWYGNQALTRAEALHGFTLGAAHAAFREADTGSIEPGKRADFVVLSQDLMAVAEEQILESRVLATYLDGEPIYTAD